LVEEENRCHILILKIPQLASPETIRTFSQKSIGHQCTSVHCRLNLRKFFTLAQISQKSAKNYPELYPPKDSYMAPFSGNLRQSEKLSEIKPPLPINTKNN
jgi:hypothetical protein